MTFTLLQMLSCCLLLAACKEEWLCLVTCHIIMGS